MMSSRIGAGVVGVLVALMSAASAAPAWGNGEQAAAIERVTLADRPAITKALDEAGTNSSALANAILAAPDDDQRAAVIFLIAHMPTADRKTLSADYLLKDVAYAFKARAATPWAGKIPLELFFNDVLPYSSVNERRDDWRQDFYDRFIGIAKSSPTAAEAAQRLNVAVFDAFNVHYHPSKRPKPDQSPYESADAGYASCTGLSILLIDACRAVGIPARMVGTPRWTTQRGNHTWVEIWDREWLFVGACEPSKLNQGWFIEQAGKADATKPEHKIYAVSFREAVNHFPLVWLPDIEDYPAEDVTLRYTTRRKVTFQIADESRAGIVTVRHQGRIVAQDRIAPATSFELPGDSTYLVELQLDGDSTPSPRTVQLTAEPNQVVPL